MRFLRLLVLAACCLSPLRAEDGTGLAATYYDNVDFTGPSLSRIDPMLAFDWPDGTPAPGQLAPEYWSAIWVGSIEIPNAGAYTFTTLSDDGVVLLVDGQAIVDDWTGHGPTEDRGTITLAAGRHPLELRFYNSHYGATLHLSWEGPGLAKQIIPTNALFPTIPPATIGTGTGLSGSYYATADRSGPATTRLDASIDFDWGDQPPLSGIPQGLFSVAWRGWIEPQYTETYTFFADADDGFALSIDGAPVIDALALAPSGERSGSIRLVGGRRYEILAQHRQLGGVAKAILRWSCPLTPKQVVPTSQLYPYDAESARAVTIASPAITYTSPAWIAGTRGSGDAMLSATVDGAVVAVARESRRGWYLADDATARVAPGVVLHPGDNDIAIVSTLGGTSEETRQTVRWAALDLSDLPYGVERLVVRPGDRLLVGSSRTGNELLVAVQREGEAMPIATVAGAPGDAFAVPFPAPGRYRLVATVDGAAAGELPVVVPRVDLVAPIADEIGFQRIKDVAVADADDGDLVFVANDDRLLELGPSAPTSDGRRLTLRALAAGDLALEARLGGPAGPILVWAPVDEFEQRTDADSRIQVIATMPDGSLLTQATLTMTPLVPGLDVVLTMYTGGATFADGTTEMTVSSSLYTPHGAAGTYSYQIVRSPRLNTGLCHDIQTYQAGVLVGNH